MKILVASDSFKGTLSSKDIGRLVQEVLDDHEVSWLSVSDGGEGLISALEGTLPGQKISCDIEDSRGRLVEGYYILTQDGKAVIESAVANGLANLSPEDRNPMMTSTYGLGQLISHAIHRGAKKILIGLGGSSTNDCGVGMLEAMGVLFKDGQGQIITGLTGKDLSRIQSFETRAFESLIAGVAFEVACDVDNPLLGKSGASYVYGPQKGGESWMLEALEAGMVHFSSLVSRSLNQDHTKVAGAGAAGGLGYCFKTFFDGRLKPGIHVVLDALDFDLSVQTVDLIITGEGRLDGQTAGGKVAMGILHRAEAYQKPVVVLCGSQEGQAYPFLKVFAIVPEVATLDAAMAEPALYLEALIKRKVKPWLKDFSLNNPFK